MRHGFCLAALLALCAAPAFGEPKKEADKDEKKPEGEKFINLGQVAGVLTGTGGSEAEYTIRVTLHVPQLNQQAAADLIKKHQQLAVRQVEIMRNRNPVQRQQQMMQLVRDAQQVPQNLITIKEVQQDVRAVPAEDMKVRLLQPPAAFDDKGNIKKYTAKELKELKGPENLTGYTGTLEDVKANQLVLVYLARKPIKAKEKDADKALDKDNPLVIRMIVILGDKK